MVRFEAEEWALEEWVEERPGSTRYRTYPIFAGPFSTRTEAEEEAKKHTPQHGGSIQVRRRPSQVATTPKRRGRRGPRRRETRRNGRR